MALFSIILACGAAARAQEMEPPTSAKPPRHGRPAVISVTDLKEFEALPDDRKKLIEGAIGVARDSPWLPYLFGGTSPEDGGFDCSGAMYFVLRKAGLEPPRTSAAQYGWLKDSGRLREISPGAADLDDPSLAKLRPGDLLFWGGTYLPTDGRTVNITHIALFLGHEKKDGRAVMINATDGRSYRGKQANGYGVYDFRLPRKGGRAVFMGFGTPPGIAE
jgi:cell wall-associated NlpC family hydrolase